GERGLLLNSDDLDTGENITARQNQLNKYKLKMRNAHLELPMNSTINAYILASIRAGADIGFTP
ncbi:hypothetical protein KA005_13295, partial [bacterium]|nr:hypothetical protein [bacterium]